MITRKTSVDAYNQIMKSGLLGKRKRQVYDYIFHNGPCTAKEMASELSATVGGRADSFQPRCNELRICGLLEEVGTAICPVSKKEQILWDVTSKVATSIAKTVLEQRLLDLGCNNLDDYYKSLKWNNFKHDYYLKHEKICFVTGEIINIQLHHITYERLGCELESDVVPVTKTIHEFIHKMIKDYKISLSIAHLVVRENYRFLVK